MRKNKLDSSATPAERLIPIGEITTTHGLKGWLRLNALNPETKALTATDGIILVKGGVRTTHELESSTPRRGGFLLKLRDVHTIDDAEKWVGSTLYVPEEALDGLKSGEYYHYQAVGLEVFDSKGDHVGIITRTWSTPGGELYVVQGATKEHLIPAVKDIIEKVDFTRGRMTINPPDGLLEL